jgi:hypothetical protein
MAVKQERETSQGEGAGDNTHPPKPLPSDLLPPMHPHLLPTFHQLPILLLNYESINVLMLS